MLHRVVVWVIRDRCVAQCGVITDITELKSIKLFTRQPLRWRSILSTCLSQEGCGWKQLWLGSLSCYITMCVCPVVRELTALKVKSKLCCPLEGRVEKPPHQAKKKEDVHLTTALEACRPPNEPLTRQHPEQSGPTEELGCSQQGKQTFSF